VKRDFSQVFASLTDINRPDYVSAADGDGDASLLQPSNIVMRHVIIGSRAFTIEQLVEQSRNNPLRTVKTQVN
jgi:hypothetical protein